MLDINREDKTVNIKITTSIGWDFIFEHSCSDTAYAAFLSKDMKEKLWKTLSDIRREAYLEGWSDKTKRKPKKDWFPGNIK